jgi:Tfp pilus assembly protein PilO
VNKLSKAQREQLIGIAIGTVVLLAALWYFGVSAKQEELSKTENNTAQTQDKLKRAENTMRQGEEIADKLQAHRQLLDKREAMLAPDRDAYAWIISTINPIIQSRKGISYPFHYSQPELSDIGIIPGFPYKWATFHVEGSGFYHDLGKFFADLENNYPYFRIQNLEMSANVSTGAEPEKLNVSFELVVPVKASDSK